MSDDSGYAPPPSAAPPIDPIYAQYRALTGANTAPIASDQLSPATLAFMQNFNQGVGSGQINPTQPLGPGGTSPIGTPLAWQPYDPTQQIFDPHQHFGATYNDPVLGKLQSVWQEPSKTQNDFWNRQLGPTLFGVALSAITGGAAMPLLGPALSTAVNYGMNDGKIDPLSTALSFLPGAAGMVDPALAAAAKAGIAGYNMSRGNTVGGGISLANLARNYVPSGGSNG